MHIFVDETGKFILKKDYPQAKVFPCLVATVFSDVALEKWNQNYSNLPKGKSIKQPKVEEVIDFLANNEVKAFLISTNFHAVSEITIQDQRDDYLLSAQDVSKNHSQAARDSIAHHCEILKNLSLPDYVKAMLLIQLFENTIRGIVCNTKLYSIEDFNSFSWNCDIMSNRIHSTVRSFVHFQINCHSNGKPIDVDDTNKISAFLNVTDSRKFLDSSKILQLVEFQSDDQCTGIKASDCIANFFSKILKGSLRFEKLDSLKKLFSLPYSLDFQHFDKDKPFIDVEISEYGRKVLDTLKPRK